MRMRHSGQRAAADQGHDQHQRRDRMLMAKTIGFISLLAPGHSPGLQRLLLHNFGVGYNLRGPAYQPFRHLEWPSLLPAGTAPDKPKPRLGKPLLVRMANQYCLGTLRGELGYTSSSRRRVESFLGSSC